MKFFKIVTSFLVLFGFFALISNAKAITVIKPDKSSGNVKIESGEIINDNVVTAGNDITIRGEINDNVIVFGRIIKISGKINGSLFAVAQEVQIEGEITKDAFIGAAEVVLAENGKVNRDFVVGSGNASILGSVGRNILAGAGSLSIDNKVGGNVTASTSEINIANSANILGSLNYYSQDEIKIDNADKIAGGINFNKIETKSSTFSSKIGNWIFGLIMSLVAGLLLIAFFPKRTNKITDCIKSNWPKSLGIGFLAFIIIPLIAFVCMILIIGLPVGLIILAVYFIIIYIAKIWVGICLGKYLMKNKGNQYWIMVLGVVILFLLYLIPIIGSIIAFFVILIGIGGFYLSKPMEGEK